MKNRNIALILSAAMLSMPFLCGCDSETAEVNMTPETGVATEAVAVAGTTEIPEGAEEVRMIRLHGKLYCDTGEEAIISCGTMDGCVTSSVAFPNVPTEDDQSNFGDDVSYQLGPDDKSIVVPIAEKYIIFREME